MRTSQCLLPSLSIPASLSTIVSLRLLSEFPTCSSLDHKLFFPYLFVHHIFVHHLFVHHILLLRIPLFHHRCDVVCQTCRSSFASPSSSNLDMMCVASSSALVWFLISVDSVLGKTIVAVRLFLLVLSLASLFKLCICRSVHHFNMTRHLLWFLRVEMRISWSFLASSACPSFNIMLLFWEFNGLTDIYIIIYHKENSSRKAKLHQNVIILNA